MPSMSYERVGNSATNMVETLNKLTVSVGDSQATTNKHLVDLKESLEELKRENQEADKMRRIEFAIQNIPAAYNPHFFDIHISLNGKRGVRSQEEGDYIVRDVLLTFRQGWSYDIDGYYIGDDLDLYRGARTDYTVNPERYQRFRDMLGNMLHKLLGKKPRFVSKDSRMHIFYE